MKLLLSCVQSRCILLAIPLRFWQLSSSYQLTVINHSLASTRIFPFPMCLTYWENFRQEEFIAWKTPPGLITLRLLNAEVLDRSSRIKKVLQSCLMFKNVWPLAKLLIWSYTGKTVILLFFYNILGCFLLNFVM